MVESKTNLLEFHIDECALSIIDETRGEISRGNFVSMAVEFALGSARFKNRFKKPSKPRVGQEIDEKIIRYLEFIGLNHRISRRAIIKWVILRMKKNPPSEHTIRRRLSRLSETGILVSEESVYGGKKKTFYRLPVGDKK